MKDTALSKGAKIAINSQVKEYGKMLKLDLDSKNKKLTMEVMLEGEKELLYVEVSRYELCEEKGQFILKVYGVHTSRAWINTLAAAHLEGRSFEIPAEYAKLLKVVI